MTHTSTAIQAAWDRGHTTVLELMHELNLDRKTVKRHLDLLGLAPTARDHRPSLRSRCTALRGEGKTWTQVAMLAQVSKVLLYRLASEWGMEWGEPVPFGVRPDPVPERLIYRCPRCLGHADSQDGHPDCRARLDLRLIGAA